MAEMFQRRRLGERPLVPEVGDGQPAFKPAAGLNDLAPDSIDRLACERPLVEALKPADHFRLAFGLEYGIFGIEFELDLPDLQSGTGTLVEQKIGRASCRERVCQYV